MKKRFLFLKACAFVFLGQHCTPPYRVSYFAAIYTENFTGRPIIR